MHQLEHGDFCYAVGSFNISSKVVVGALGMQVVQTAGLVPYWEAWGGWDAFPSFIPQRDRAHWKEI